VGPGRGNGSGFAPAAPVTRAQTALLLARLLRQAGVPLDGRNPGFTDTAGLSPEAREAINNVANAQVARGTSQTSFTPGAPVTRGQLASFLVRLQGRLGVALPRQVHCFADTSASVHREAAQRLCAAGIARGDGAGSFGPGSPVTRGQVAGLLARTLDLDVEAGRLAPPSS
jgi:arabinogalactan endo-1,4-beta-galactosidase